MGDIMKKSKIKELIISNPCYVKWILYVYNSLNIKNRLHAKGAKLIYGVSIIRGLKILNHGSNNEIFIGDFSRIKNSKIVIRGNNNKVIIGDYTLLNQIDIYMEDDGNEIRIGEHTALCGKADLATIEGTKIVIGENCLFSSGLHFRTGDSHSLLNELGERINPSEDIIIGDHVWIGTRVTCLKGVHVAKDSVVAATTTLCKHYNEENVVIAGVPGRVVKTGVNWTHERIKMNTDS